MMWFAWLKIIGEKLVKMIREKKLVWNSYKRSCNIGWGKQWQINEYDMKKWFNLKINVERWNGIFNK